MAVTVIPDFAAKFAMDRDCLDKLRKIGIIPRHIFDVGACNGAWTRHVRADFPEATFDMFEPLAPHSALLREGFDRTVDGERYRLHSVALGPESKHTTMFMYPDNIPGSTALELGFSPSDAKPVEIEMLTIDDAITRLSLPIPDFIKMDTQGCELNILKGACHTLPKVDALLLECWLTRAYGPSTPLLLEVAEWLRDFDFYLWELADQWRDPAGTLVSQDCFFLNARCKVSPLHSEPRHSEKEPLPVGKNGRGWRRALSRMLRK